MAALVRFMFTVALTLFAERRWRKPRFHHGTKVPPRMPSSSLSARSRRQGGADFVPPAERIAVFDNDGTLWTEQPGPVQLAFALDRVKALAPQHPEWKDKQPFKAALEGDMKALAESGERGFWKCSWRPMRA